MEKINLTKLIAESSPYSRRQAEKIIRMGEVKINDRIALLGEKADKNDKIEINGKEIKFQNTKIYIKLNKPVDYVCTNRIFPGEKNIFSLLPKENNLFSIGRLDKNSHGLIVLSNDGDLTYKLTHPRFQHEKIYLVKLKENYFLKNKGLLGEILSKFKEGVDIGDRTLAKAKKIEIINDNTFRIILTEGKKRQIREMFNYFNLKVTDLKRTDFAGINLGNLKEGEWTNLNPEEIKKLKNI
ncbi:pseudouridine synthase [Candidatus Falkowbacteria bacterium HGW-Falkowbacteria-1]|uniref:Pseudouridine synthase n=1 Tax=Candidatus Falkowbacteria bacterium HGW-Falkowbacteria-1 TaxID=2013768 RepID=A0A2N2E8V9_9BACT|nr:MAG: pseudouridine synthase [Candidatus Falkowbacteria bacterium HGW-Falkowbacteria-1]